MQNYWEIRQSWIMISCKTIAVLQSNIADFSQNCNCKEYYEENLQEIKKKYNKR